MRQLSKLISTSSLIAVVGLSAMMVLLMASGSASAKPGAMKVKAVVELFTSQGCSSCPPADKLLKTYVDKKDVIALTMPVDYWDYLGWKDTLASPANTKRQRDYAIKRGDGQVYTPQLVINGIAHEVGSRKPSIDRTIEKTSLKIQANKVPMRIWLDNGTMVVEAGSPADGAKLKGATIWLATVQKEAPISIRRGENSGRKISYYNVVKDLTAIGMWNGKSVSVRLAKHAVMRNGADGCIVFLQYGKAGPIIGGAELKHW